MRNPNRIEPILEEIKEIWEKNPDLRLLQLLLNTNNDYYTEDDKLLEDLREFYNE